MTEFQKMVERALALGSWSWIKWMFLGTAILSVVGYFLARQRRTSSHVTVNVIAFATAIYLFAHGVVTRGLMGGVGKHDHSWPFWLVLVLHIGAGFLYLVFSGVQVVTGVRILSPGPMHANIRYGHHSTIGRVAVGCLCMSATLSLFL